MTIESQDRVHPTSTQPAQENRSGNSRRKLSLPSWLIRTTLATALLLGVSSSARAQDSPPPEPTAVVTVPARLDDSSRTDRLPVQETEPIPSSDPEILLIGGDGGSEHLSIKHILSLISGTGAVRGIDPSNIRIVSFEEPTEIPEGSTLFLFDQEPDPLDFVSQQIAEAIVRADKELFFVVTSHHVTGNDLETDSFILRSDPASIMSMEQMGQAIARGIALRDPASPIPTIRVILEACEAGNSVMPQRSGGEAPTPYPLRLVNLYDHIRAELRVLGIPNAQVNVIVTAPSSFDELTTAMIGKTFADYLMTKGKTVESLILSWPPEGTPLADNRSQSALNDSRPYQGVWYRDPLPDEAMRAGIHVNSTTLGVSVSFLGFSPGETESVKTAGIRVANHGEAPTEQITVTMSSASGAITELTGTYAVVDGLPPNAEKQLFIALPQVSAQEPITGLLTIGIDGIEHTIYIDDRAGVLPKDGVVLDEESSAISVVYNQEKHWIESSYLPTLQFTQAYSMPVEVMVAVLNDDGRAIQTSHFIMPEQLVGASPEHPVAIQLVNWISDMRIRRGKIRVYSPAGDLLFVFEMTPDDKNDLFTQADAIETHTGEYRLNTIAALDTDLFALPKDGLTKSITVTAYYHGQTLPPGMEVSYFDQNHEKLSTYITLANPRISAIQLNVPPGAAYIGTSGNTIPGSTLYGLKFNDFIAGSLIYLPVMAKK